MDEKLQNDLRAYFDTNLSRMSGGSEVQRRYVGAFQCGVLQRINNECTSAGDAVLIYLFKELQEQADTCAEAQKQLDTLMLQRPYTFVFYGSSENVFSTTLKLREHLRLSWRTAWDIAFQLRKGESVSVTTVLSNVQAVAAFINMPKVTFSSED